MKDLFWYLFLILLLAFQVTFYVPHSWPSVSRRQTWTRSFAWWTCRVSTRFSLRSVGDFTNEHPRPNGKNYQAPSRSNDDPYRFDECYNLLFPVYPVFYDKLTLSHLDYVCEIRSYPNFARILTLYKKLSMKIDE